MIDPQTYRASAALYAGEVRTAGSMPSAPQWENSAASPMEQEEKDGGNFLSFLFGVIDIINPLQHIPVVSTIYRHLTGDEISPMARIAGDAIYGGPVGAAVAFADVAVEQTTGEDIGGNVMAMLTDRKDAEGEAPSTMLASRMDGIAPASGNDDIVWTTPAYAASATDAAQASVSGTRLALLNQQEFSQEFSSSLPPLHTHRTGTKETEPALHSTPIAPPVSAMKDGTSGAAVLTAAAGDAEQNLSASRHPDPAPVLLLQEAPDGRPRTAMSPEPIALKMMEALEKYEAMKKARM